MSINNFSYRALLTSLIWLISVSTVATAADDYDKVQKLFDTSTTIVGETLHYPTSGSAKLSSLIVTMDPGESTDWHKHGAPLYAYMLEGTLTVDYRKKGKRTYQQGDAFMEAMSYWHQGRNTGSKPARILVLFLGSENVKNVIHETTGGSDGE